MKMHSEHNLDHYRSFLDRFCEGLSHGYESYKKERNLFIFNKLVESGKHMKAKRKNKIKALDLANLDEIRSLA